MSESLLTRLIEKKNCMGLTVPKLALALNIPPDRIYKWEQGKGNPKGADIEKIKNWLEEVPNVPLGMSKEDSERLAIAILNMTEVEKRSAQSILNLTDIEKRSSNTIERLVRLLEAKYLPNLHDDNFPKPDDTRAEHLTNGSIPGDREKK